MPRCRLLLALILVVNVSLFGCGGGGGSGSGAEQSDNPSAAAQAFMLGAHYYHWFPQNFPHGYLRGKLAPAQEPLLGEYNSRDPRVAEQHIEWASSAGINFFTLDWWPNRPQQNSAIDQGFLRASNLSKMKFCIFYETGDLGYSPRFGGIAFGPSEINQFVSDMRNIAKSYFSHPQYLTIRGRPVVVLYITRTLVGSYAEAFAKARAAVKDLGFDIFLVGDEIFWAVSEADRSDVVISGEPQRSRIALFDAITPYNFYEGSFLQQSGYVAESQFISEVNGLLDRYRAAAGDVPIFPSIVPGYNDRGVRLSAGHYPIPRQYAQGESSTSTFEELYNQILLRNLDEDTPVGFITSWNEWNEDTAIEPTAPAPGTSRDTSTSGTAYTQGYVYEGVGTGYLEVLRRLR